MLAISIDNDSEEAAAEYDLRPAAPKRRRGNERGDRLAGFAAAADRHFKRRRSAAHTSLPARAHYSSRRRSLTAAICWRVHRLARRSQRRLRSTRYVDGLSELLLGSRTATAKRTRPRASSRTHTQRSSRAATTRPAARWRQWSRPRRPCASASKGARRSAASV